MCSYPPGVLTLSEPPSPMLAAALHALHDEATAPELEERLHAAGVTLAPGLADRLPRQLGGLGLVRVGRVADGVTHFVPTSLGLQARRQDVAGEGATFLADL